MFHVFSFFNLPSTELLAKSIKTLQYTDSDSVIHVHKPTRTTRKGEFIDVTTFDALSHVAKNRKIRQRRSVEPRNVREKLDANLALKDGNHIVFFDLGHVAGSPLSGARLHLKRNYKLVSENFIVEERSRGGKIDRRHSLIHECHYTGVIHNHDSFSRVALSLCNGMVSSIVKAMMYVITCVCSLLVCQPIGRFGPLKSVIVVI